MTRGGGSLHGFLGFWGAPVGVGLQAFAKHSGRYVDVGLGGHSMDNGEERERG